MTKKVSKPLIEIAKSLPDSELTNNIKTISWKCNFRAVIRNPDKVIHIMSEVEK